MENIILQVCQEFITEVLDFFKEDRPISLSEIEQGIEGSSEKSLREIIKAYLEETDRQIVGDKAGRKKRGLVIERRNEAWPKKNKIDDFDIIVFYLVHNLRFMHGLLTTRVSSHL